MKSILMLFAFSTIATVVHAVPVERQTVVVDDNTYPVYEFFSEVKPVSQSNPVYPAKAKKERRGGETLVGVVVSENGKVTKAFVEKASADSDIQEAARTAVTRWKFPKLKVGKKPISYVVFVLVMMNPE
jgi:TonB family protein